MPRDRSDYDEIIAAQKADGTYPYPLTMTSAERDALQAEVAPADPNYPSWKAPLLGQQIVQYDGCPIVIDEEDD